MSRTLDWLHSLDRIADEISELWLDQSVWRGICQMTDQVPAARGSFIVAWIGQQYYRRAALAVRAMVDGDQRSDSLVNLLTDIKRNPSDLTCPGSMWDMRAQGTSTVDPALVDADIVTLKAAAANVGVYVSKYLAHIDKTPTMPIPALTEVDDAVQLLGEKLKKYTLLLRNADLEVEPRFNFDWAAGLREAWLPAPPPAAR